MTDDTKEHGLRLSKGDGTPLDPRRDAGGKFGAGNSASLGNKGGRPRKEPEPDQATDPLDIGPELIEALLSTPCPKPIEKRGHSAIWRALLAQVAAGDKGAAAKALDIVERYYPNEQPPESEETDARYDHLPATAAELARDLDCNIADVTARFERGLPCSDLAREIRGRLR